MSELRLQVPAALVIGTTPISGGAAGGVLFDSGPGTLQEDTSNFLYTTSSGPRLQVGSGSTTSKGIIAGYSGSSGFSGVWGSNYTVAGDVGLIFSASSVIYGGPASGTNTANLVAWSDGQVDIKSGSSAKTTWVKTAGAGPTLIAGTATTDVQALSATQTWNASGVTFTAEKLNVTNTASAAGSLLKDMQVGSVSKFKVDKAGALTITAGFTLDGAQTFTTDNASDIGATGANRPRTLYLGTSIQIEANAGLKLTNQTDGAAAQVGTLTNAPSAGNPIFWLPVAINGTTRYVPAWA